MPTLPLRIVLGLFEPWSFYTMSTFGVSSSCGTRHRPHRSCSPRLTIRRTRRWRHCSAMSSVAARGYMTWMCEVLELPDPEIRIPPEPTALLEHAVMHPIRHAFQLEELMHQR